MFMQRVISLCLCKELYRYVYTRVISLCLYKGYMQRVISLCLYKGYMQKGYMSQKGLWNNVPVFKIGVVAQHTIVLPETRVFKVFAQ